MRTEPDAIRFQAEEHPLVPTTEFHSLEEYTLYLIHRVAYEEAAKFSDERLVLDIGCNTGYGTALISQKSRKTIGVDVSPKCVATANEQNASDNIEYRVIDGVALPFDDQTFDLVVSFQVIEHVFTPDRYLSEIRRVLKPGGTVIFTTPNAPIRLDPGMKPWNEFHVREFTAAELEQLLKGWFTSVQVKGLFARPELYDIEYRRVQRTKQQARRTQELESRASWKAKRKAIELAKALLPSAAVDAVRRILRSRHPAPAVIAPALDESFVNRYSTADFEYRADDLDRALDLMAMCSTERA